MADYQEKQQIETEREPTQPHALAVIGSVSGNTATLKFDGATSASAKYYKCNKSVNFAAGDRVVVMKIAGTYVVAFKI